MEHKYKLSDLNCNFCLKKGNLGCSYSLCPYIMGNLSELFADDDFRNAVKNAETGRTAHRNTLKHLKKQAITQGYDLFDENEDISDSYGNEIKPECKQCNYKSPGFICFNKKAGTCLTDWIKEIENARR